MNTVTNWILIRRNADKSIAEVIRTYLSANRAAEDRDLLQQVNPGVIFDVEQIEHIDN